MPPTTYRKIVLQRHSYSLSEALTIEEEPLRETMPNELLLRNLYVGINYPDIAAITGFNPAYEHLPQDLGLEALAEVVAVGSDVQDMAVGDYVIAAFFGNGFREYNVIDAFFTIKIPTLNLDYLALLLSACNAYIGLHYILRLTGKETVLITSAVANSGYYMAQFAQAIGCKVTACCLTTSEAQQLQSLGLTRLIVREEEDLDAVLSAEYPYGFDFIFDELGGQVLTTAIHHIAPKGKVLVSNLFSEYLDETQQPELSFDILYQIVSKSAIFYGFNLTEYAHLIPEVYTLLRNSYESGQIKVLCDPTPFEGLEGIIEAMQHIIEYRQCGKVIVRLDPSHG
ncbi:hypothetical protein MASR2M15_22390 [Anaerolineales bacterium]